MISFDNLFPQRKGAIAKWSSQFLIKKTLKDFTREMAVLRSLHKRIPSSFCFAFFARCQNSLKKMNCFQASYDCPRLVSKQWHEAAVFKSDMQQYECSQFSR